MRRRSIVVLCINQKPMRQKKYDDDNEWMRMFMVMMKIALNIKILLFFLSIYTFFRNNINIKCDG